MRKLLTGIILVLSSIALRAQIVPSDVADSVYVGGQMFHVQGLAIDRVNGYMYFSFTSQFFKTDLEGNILASIDRVQGHLGAMTLSPVDGKVYASLECKDDEIGANISKKLEVKQLDRASSVFYIAVIDVNKLTRRGMDPEKDGVMTTVCVKEACADYKAVVPVAGSVKVSTAVAGSAKASTTVASTNAASTAGDNLSADATMDHRFACSGIDGVTFGPALGHKAGKPVKKWYLYVAYGVYGDNSRTDNDYNVLLCYDVSNWGKYETPVTFGEVHTNGPAKPHGKYFVRTMNTTWGVQNMAYDSYTNRFFLAVYKGKKPGCPNYDLYAVDASVKPYKAHLEGNAYCTSKVRQLTLADDGLCDDATATCGWRFKWGSTGLCSLGDGYWIISEKGKNKTDNTNSCNARLYHWTGDPVKPFEKVNR